MYQSNESIASGSCSCTYCRESVCHCTYCNLEDSDSDEEYPPPPPLPPRDSELYQNSIDCQSERFMNVATQFHTFVLLLKHFCKWNNFKKCRKTQIAAQRTLLRRIVFRWRSFSEQRIQISKGFISLADLIQLHHYRVLRHSLECFIQKSNALRCLEERFQYWRLVAQMSLKDQNEKAEMAWRAYRLNSLYQCFKSWQQYTLIATHRRHRDYSHLQHIWEEWMQTMIDSKANHYRQSELARNHFLSKCSYRARVILRSWHHYVCSRRRLKRAFHQIQHSYRLQLLSISTKAWATYHNSLKVAFNSLRRTQTRIWLKMWRRIAFSIKHDRELLLKIIVNRWWIYTQDMLEKKRLRKVATSQWKQFKLKSSFVRWISFVENERDRLRTPRFRTKTIMKEAAWTSIHNCKRYTSNFSSHAHHFKKYNQTSLEPTNSVIPKRFVSVPKSRVSFTRYNRSFDRSTNMAKSLSPPKFISKSHMMTRNQSVNLNSFRGHRSLLQQAKAPAWVKDALANHSQVLRSHCKEVHPTAEPKTCSLYDSSSLRRLNDLSFRRVTDSKGLYHGSDFKSHRSSDDAQFKLNA